jgi:hypothetical protein
MVNNSTAIEKIDIAEKKGLLICFDKNNGFPQVDLYRTEITEITIDKDNDCYCISKKYMPKKEVVDRIGEASGVIFVNGTTSTHTLDDNICGKRTVYIGTAQGKVRMPDGTWRTSSICEYEFDPTLRAMDDYDITELTPETKKSRKKWEGKEKTYGDTLAQAIVDYQKTARQRANTGARLRVIRELVGLPIALTAEQVSKPVVFGRIVQNTSYILQTPEGRAMATAQALGVDMATLFGGKKSPDNQSAIQDMSSDNKTYSESTTTVMAEAAPVSTEPDFPDEPTGPGSEQEDMLAQKTVEIEQLMNSYKDALDVISANGKNPYEMAQKELANPNATIETRESMIKRLYDWLKNKGINA